MSWQAAAVCLLTAALWGGTAVAVSFSVDQVPPILAAAIRFTLAAAFMLAWCLARGVAVGLQTGEGRIALIAGALLFVQIGVFHLGIARSSSSHATVLINTYVFGVAAVEHFLLGTHRLTRGKLAGLAVAAAGGLLILFTASSAPASGRDEPTLIGDLLLVASSATLCVKVIYIKHAVRHIEPTRLILWHDLIGVVLFFAWSAAFEGLRVGPLRAATVLGLLYQGVIVGGFCFGVQAVLLRKYAASQVAIFSVATPLFGILFAHLFRGDPLSPWLLLSAASVTAGIALVNRS
jgi:drug/metabolite transporter (DMT)-like permease